MGNKNIPPGPGRPKGSKNKLSRDLKEQMFQIMEKLEADGKGLAEEADKDPTWFYTNFVKPMLPKNVEVSGKDGNPIEFNPIERTNRIAAILGAARTRRDRQDP